MKIGEAIGRGIRVLKENPIIFVPATLSGILAVVSLSFTAPSPHLSFTEMIRFLLVVLLLITLLLLINLFLNGMIIKMSYDATKGKTSLSGSVKFVARKYGTLLLASIIFGIVVFLGPYIVALIISIPLLILRELRFPAMFIPLIGSGILTIFMVIKLLFYGYAILVDGNSAIDSLKKSWNITKGNWWRIFVIVLVFGIPMGIPAGLSGILPLSASAILTFLVTLFITSWLYSSLTFAYIQLKEAASVEYCM